MYNSCHTAVGSRLCGVAVKRVTRVTVTGTPSLLMLGASRGQCGVLSLLERVSLLIVKVIFVH